MHVFYIDGASNVARLKELCSQRDRLVVPMHQQAAALLAENGIVFAPTPDWNQAHREISERVTICCGNDDFSEDWRNLLVEYASPLYFLDPTRLASGAPIESLTVYAARGIDSALVGCLEWIAGEMKLPLRRIAL